MFVHVAKDYMKKIEDIEARLAVSLDKDEIQTLGLKLRFFFNEIRHYRTLLDELHNKIIDTQARYGFKPEETRQEVSRQEPPPQAQPVETQAGADAPEVDVMGVLKQWVSNLQDKGYTPEELLAAAGVGDADMAMAREFAPPDEIPALASSPAPAKAADAAPADVIGPIGSPEQPAAAQPVAAIPRAQPAAPAIPAAAPAARELPRGVAAAIPVAAAVPVPVETAVPAMEEPLMAAPAVPAQPEIDIPAPAPPEPEAAAMTGRDIIEPAPAGPPEPGMPPITQPRMPEPAPEEFEPPPPAEPNPLTASLQDLLAHWSEKYSGAERVSEALQQSLDTLMENRRGEVITALDKFAERIKTNPAALELPPFALFLFGHFAFALDRHGFAINLLEKAVSDGIGYAACHLELARCYTKKNAPAKALINYKFASRVDPSLTAAVLGIAESLIGMGQHEDALEYINTQKFRTESDQVRSVLLKSSALEALDRRPEAEKLLERLAGVCEEPRSKALCLFQLGRMHEKKKDVLRAIDFFEDTVAADPDNLEARFNLGRLYTQHQAFPLAKKHLMYLTASHPDTLWADRARELL